MMSETLKQQKGISIDIILSKLDTDIKLGTDKPENILGFHGQTVCVCDTSSFFSGISKIKIRWKQYL